MNYDEYLKLPDVEQEFNQMFEQQRDYYRLKSREFGIAKSHIELFAIKMAHLSTELHFTERFHSLNDKTKAPLLTESEA